MDNEQRIFEDLLSVSAWHLEFNAENEEVDLHALVVFNQSKLGDVDDVSFTLKLNKAKLQLELPAGFEVLEETIVQIAPTSGSQKRADSKKTKSEFTFSGLVKKSIPFMDVGAQVGATHEHTEITESATETTIIQGRAMWTKKKVWWEFTTIDNSPLDGPAWESGSSKRMTVSDMRKPELRLSDNQNNLNPPIIVKVVCTREELEIEIDNSLGERLNGKNMAAAESYIRDVLTSRRLEFEGDLSLKSPNAMIELASGFAGTR